MTHRNKIVLISSTILISLAILILLLVHYINGPAQGQISNNLSPLPSQTSNFNLSPIKVSGEYISFNYPASLTADTYSKNSGSILESYVYQYKDIQPWLLVLEVNKLSQPNLNYDSSYSLRKDNPNRYQTSTLTIASKTFVVMTDTSTPGFSKVAFILNGNMSVDVSLNGDDQFGLGNLQATFNMVLNSLLWKH